MVKLCWGHPEVYLEMITVNVQFLNQVVVFSQVISSGINWMHPVLPASCFTPLVCGVHKSVLYPSNDIGDSTLGLRNGNATPTLTRGVNGP